jgi:hypothetical protein
MAENVMPMLTWEKYKNICEYEYKIYEYHENGYTTACTTFVSPIYMCCQVETIEVLILGYKSHNSKFAAK